MSKHTNVSRRMLHRREGVTRTRSCNRKTRYSRAMAQRMAELKTWMTDEVIHAYECVFCPSWHIGHPRKDGK